MVKPGKGVKENVPRIRLGMIKGSKKGSGQVNIENVNRTVKNQTFNTQPPIYTPVPSTSRNQPDSSQNVLRNVTNTHNTGKNV